MAGTTKVYLSSLAKEGGACGALNVTDGGKFSPGNSRGVATRGSTSWGAGGSYLFEVNDAAGVAGTNWDLWNINGGLSITAGGEEKFPLPSFFFFSDASQALRDGAEFNRGAAIFFLHCLISTAEHRVW